MSWKTTLILGLYFAFFMLCAVAIIWWQRRQKKMRLPFGEQLRLLRGPGETQLRLSREFDEVAPVWVAVAAGMPVLVAAVMMQWITRVPEVLQLGWLALTAVVFIGMFLLAARIFASKMRESGNRYLGYFGERIVAEHLEPLKQERWRVFHDVPGLANGQKFNIDHVAVGPGGVCVIETKTRRKGSARPGFEDHKVFFDGQDLVWPWGEDNHGLDQAERNATWLAEDINRSSSGTYISVNPVLALPGWFVEMKPMRDSRPCRVANPSWLPDMLTRERTVLDQQQIDAVAAKIEAKCRDVKY